MSASSVEVVASSRLHFGMLSFGQAGARQFGGVGAMVAPGALRLRIVPAERFTACGPLAARVRVAMEHIARNLAIAELPACQVEVVAAPREHVGLGTGTQLALSLAAGLNALRGGGPLDPASLAAQSGRGARSAIGTYGFAAGGLLIEHGKLPDEPLSPLVRRVELPSSWRFALVCPPDRRGLSGKDEQQAFRNLPPVPSATTERLLNEVSRELVPAAAAGQFERFGESLYRFGREAGLCFTAAQGGAFAGPQIDELVAAIRSLGVRGVGQSSWGPTVFALLESAAEAERFCQQIVRRVPCGATITVAEPSNSGAKITRL
jgi:beta-ribofuranosylaminobenzene 5'-phosphate synthase